MVTTENQPHGSAIGVDESNGSLTRADHIAHGGATDDVGNGEEPEAGPAPSIDQQQWQPHADAPGPTAGAEEAPADGLEEGCHAPRGSAALIGGSGLRAAPGGVLTLSQLLGLDHPLGRAVERHRTSAHPQVSSAVLEDLVDFKIQIDVELAAGFLLFN